VHEEESAQQKAVRLLTRQLGQLQTVRGFEVKHPEFKAWRDSTREILERFLGKESHHTTRFRDTRFYGPSYLRSDYPGVRQPPEGYEERIQAQAFKEGCETADASLRAAIKHVEDFGIYEEQAKPGPAKMGRSGGVSFHAPVTVANLAIASDSAVQEIGHVGDKAGADLKEIAELLNDSQDLTPRQLKQGVSDIEALAVEAKKPEDKRNWKAVLERGQAVLDVAAKAVDLGAKLAPHTATIIALMDQAKHYIK